MTIQAIELSKGVDLPKPRVVFAYPYGEMEVGDSFVVPAEYRAKVLNANYRAGKRLGRKFMSNNASGLSIIEPRRAISASRFCGGIRRPFVEVCAMRQFYHQAAFFC